MYSENMIFFFRTSLNPKRETIAFQRQETIKRLDKIIESHVLEGYTAGKWLSTREYRDMMKNTKIMTSIESMKFYEILQNCLKEKT